MGGDQGPPPPMTVQGIFNVIPIIFKSNYMFKFSEEASPEANQDPIRNSFQRGY